ncbi:MAG: tetratricopeptide repeat protein, partial [Chitinophagaceae bacterium]
SNLTILVIASLVAGYVIGLLAWPWGLDSPISHPIASLEGMTNRATKIHTLFEGTYQWNFAMPWYYELKWMLISNPISVVFGMILFAVLGFLGRKKIGLFLLLFGVFAAFFPLVYMMYKHSSVYDTWRHVFFVYPFWVVMAALGWMFLGDIISEKLAKKKPAENWYPGHAIALLLLIPAIIWTFKSHPNQYVYFNEFVGGIQGAEGNYELDYYYNSSQQQVDWLLKNARSWDGKKKALVLSNMGGFGPNCLQGDTGTLDASYLSYSRIGTQPWDYYMMFPRLIPEGLVTNKTWLPKNAVHVVSVDGVPLSAIIKRTDTFDIAAEHAMVAKDFNTAATDYGQSLKSYPNNTIMMLNYANALAQANRLPEAITVLQEATKINPEDANAWQFLAQLYHATGNAQAARDAQSRAQSIAAAMQVDEP